MMFSKNKQKIEHMRDFKEDSNQRDALSVGKGRNVEDVYRKYLEMTCWWMNEKWKNKTVNQQVTLDFMDYRIDLYNFSQVLLEDWHISVLKSWMAYLLGFSVGKILEKIQYILIDDEDKPNPFTGEPKFGSIDRDQKAIIVYPAGLSKEKYGLGDISRWEGILWHEIAHWFESGLFNRLQWMKKFGWVELEMSVIAPGGAELNWMCSQPERCIDKYARLNLMDDFAESFVAMRFCPEILDEEKLIYMFERVIKNTKIYPLQIDMRLRRNGDIVYPFLSQPLYYKWREGVRVIK